MYPVVKSAFKSFNVPFEAAIPYMYQDIKGLITVGVGNLIDPVDAALGLPFRWKTKPGIKTPGAAAGKQDIKDEWNRIKNDKSLAQKGHTACEPITNLELSDSDIDDLIETRLNQNEAFLKRQKPFLDFDKWPADAQLGILSMAWAAGPGFFNDFPKFSAGCAKQDFDTAADECKLDETGNAGVAPRNRADKRLFQNAAAVVAGEADGFYSRSILYFPQMLLKPMVITPGP